MNLGQWIGFLAVAVSLYILWQIRQVLLLVFAAVVLANSLNLLARRFQAAGFAAIGSGFAQRSLLSSGADCVLSTHRAAVCRAVSRFDRAGTRQRGTVERLDE